MTDSLEIQEREPAEVEIYACRYERFEHCKARNCRALGTQIARYLDSSGIFVRQYELCGLHIERLIARDRQRGLKVSDNRAAE